MKQITKLEPGQIFVFGSNEAGRHGMGAAKTAYIEFGAAPGVGVGRTGRCYAIPTKDKNLRTLPLTSIGRHVAEFLVHASENQGSEFLVTPIGTGLAGYRHEQIAPMFHKAPPNCVLPQEWNAIVQGEHKFM